MKSICHTIQGRSHLTSETPCQTKTCKYINPPFTFIALADGAKDAKYSHLGAEYAIQVVMKLLEKKFDDYYVNASLNSLSISTNIIQTLNQALSIYTKNKAADLQDKAYTQTQNSLSKVLKAIEENRNKLYPHPQINCREEIERKILGREEMQMYIKEQQENNKRKKFIEQFKKHRDKDLAILQQAIREQPQQSLANTETKRGIISSIKEYLPIKKQSESLQGSFSIKYDLAKFDVFKEQINQSVSYTSKEQIQNILNNMEMCGRQLLEETKTISENIKIKGNFYINTADIHKKMMAIFTEFLSKYEVFKLKEQSFLTQELKACEKEIEALQKDQKEHDKLNQALTDSIKTTDECYGQIHQYIIQLLKKAIQQYNIQEGELLSRLSDKLSLCISELEEVRKKALIFTKRHQDTTNDLEQFIFDNIDHILQDIHIACFTIENSYCQIHDFASTLLFVAIKEDQCLIGHLGDGVIGTWYNNELKVISAAENTNPSDEILLTTSKGAEQKLKIITGNIREKNITAFALISRGGAEGLYSKKEQKIVPVLERLINEAKEGYSREQDIEKLLERVKNEKTFNDCGIAILYQYLKQ